MGAWTTSPDGRFAVYGAAHAPSGQLGLGRVDLLRVAPTSRPARRESSPMVVRGDAGEDFAFTGNGGLLYEADQEQDGVLELFLRYPGKLGLMKR